MMNRRDFMKIGVAGVGALALTGASRHPHWNSIPVRRTRNGPCCMRPGTALPAMPHCGFPKAWA